MIVSPRLALAALPLALLAACQDDAAPAGEGDGASGEVLEGTINDDMLPLDEVRSQPPLLEPRPTAASTGSSGTDTSGDSEGASEETPSPSTDEPSVMREGEPEEPAAE